MKKHHAIGALAAFIAAILMYSALAYGQGSQFDFLLNQQRNASGSLAGGTATFYEVGSMTPKAIYSDIGLTTLALNPYTLNSAGKAQLYGSGLYKVVIKNSAGVTQYTYDNVAVNSLGGYIASQTPTSGQIPVLGANREFRIKNGATTRDAFRDKGATGILFGSMDYASAWLTGFGDANIGAGYDPYGVPATNSAWLKLSPTGAIIAKVSTNAGASFSAYSAWTPGSGANKVSGYAATPTPTINKIPVADQTDGRLAWGWKPAFRGAQAKLTAAQSIADNIGSSPIAWTTEVYDTDTMHDNSTNNTRVTIPTGITKARATVYIEWGINSTGHRQVSIQRYTSGGSIYVGGSWHHLQLAATASQGGLYGTATSVATPVIPVVAGDYFVVDVWQNSGGALNVVTSSTFAVELIE